MDLMFASGHANTLAEKILADADSIYLYLYEDNLRLYRKAVNADVGMAIASRMSESPPSLGRR